MLNAGKTTQKAVASATRPFHWRIVSRGASTSLNDRNLHLEYGRTRIPIKAISTVTACEPMDWDVAGQFLNFILYMVIAGLFLAAVVWMQWRWQFLFGTTLFAGIALMSLADVFTTRKLGFYRLQFDIINGGKEVYTTSSKDDRDQLAAEVVSRIGNQACQ